MKVNYADCVMYLMTTMPFHSASVAKQMPSMCHLKSRPAIGKINLDYRYCMKNDYVVHSFPKTILVNLLFKETSLCKNYFKGMS